MKLHTQQRNNESYRVYESVCRQAFKTWWIWINNCPVLRTNWYTEEEDKFCLSWPNKTSKIWGRLQNITNLLDERTIMNYWNLILPLNSIFYGMWYHFSLDGLSLEIGEILAIRKNWQVFETGGRTYFALLVDTLPNKIGSSATRALDPLLRCGVWSFIFC